MDRCEIAFLLEDRILQMAEMLGEDDETSLDAGVTLMLKVSAVALTLCCTSSGAEASKDDLNVSSVSGNANDERRRSNWTALKSVSLALPFGIGLSCEQLRE